MCLALCEVPTLQIILKTALSCNKCCVKYCCSSFAIALRRCRRQDMVVEVVVVVVVVVIVVVVVVVVVVVLVVVVVVVVVIIKSAVEEFEVRRVHELESKRDLHKSGPPSTSNSECQFCHRMCRSQIGLLAHNKSHL